MSGVPIRPPTEADGLTASEVAEWHRVQRVLEADPRTAGDANRPTWLVRRVLEEERAGGRCKRFPPRYADDGVRCAGHPEWKPWEPRRVLREDLLCAVDRAWLYLPETKQILRPEFRCIVQGLS